jgi:hypothetical protein
MADQKTTFDISDIVSFIRERGWEGCEDFSADDLKNSNASKIREVHYFFLVDFGFSKDILHTKFGCFEAEEELFRDITPLLNLQACLNWLLGKLSPGSKWQLGLRDLTHPNPKRTQFFLTVLQNFWLFYSHIYESLMQREGEVRDLVQEREQLFPMVRDLEERMAEADNSLSAAEFKWSRRKAAKEEDVRELKEVLKEGRRQLGQEEQQVHALTAQAVQLQEQVVEARHHLQEEDAKTKLEYAATLEKLELFNTKLAAEFDAFTEMKRILDATHKRGDE